MGDEARNGENEGVSKRFNVPSREGQPQGYVSREAKAQARMTRRIAEWEEMHLVAGVPEIDDQELSAEIMVMPTIIKGKVIPRCFGGHMNYAYAYEILHGTINGNVREARYLAYKLNRRIINDCTPKVTSLARRGDLKSKAVQRSLCEEMETKGLITPEEKTLVYKRQLRILHNDGRYALVKPGDRAAYVAFFMMVSQAEALDPVNLIKAIPEYAPSILFPYCVFTAYILYALLTRYFERRRLGGRAGILSIKAMLLAVIADVILSYVRFNVNAVKNIYGHPFCALIMTLTTILIVFMIPHYRHGRLAKAEHTPNPSPDGSLPPIPEKDPEKVD